MTARTRARKRSTRPTCAGCRALTARLTMLHRIVGSYEVTLEQARERETTAQQQAADGKTQAAQRQAQYQRTLTETLTDLQGCLQRVQTQVASLAEEDRHGL